MPDYSQLKLGKGPARLKPQTLRLGKYLTGEFPPLPEELDNSRGIRTGWGMLANDRLGCCTISGIGHAIQSWRLSLPGQSSLISIPDKAIETYYSVWDGWNPLDPATDQGGVEHDVLTHWRKGTFAVNGVGHNLRAFASVDPMVLQNVRRAIQLFGGVYLGVELPLSAQSQSFWSLVDGPEGAPGSWGGHCVWAVSYAPGKIGFISWGEYLEMDLSFWQACVSECWALISDTDWMQSDGVDYWTLQKDLEVITA